ncbi:MAG: N-acetyltransferase [Sphingobacterium sp.]|uniref:N-acetyltransferase n=1 Tax=Sphingobacterium sp. TaxID=341027 RepID=UPI0028191E0E|nr:N-acetyltransferase [Sphingobacterium sp.]MDR0261737.1 N-acetyltransferase [Sphingobacterium sp.]
MNIITKFTVATEQGIEALLMLTKTLAVQKFAQLLNPVELEHYIIENFNVQTLVSEINSMSNQWLVVYVDDQPMGYARITSKGQKPIAVGGKRAIRIADFGVCEHQAQPQIMTSLIDKCLAVCSTYEVIWINEPAGSSSIGLFEQKGFIRQPGMSRFDELPLESALYLKINL